MKHDLICTWLELPVEDWPPTYYQLLGLPPGESNIALIEQRVQQRLEKVRCYQLAHPEQATEALNRLAQAYVCLTEPSAKQRYDASLCGGGTIAVLELPRKPDVSTDTPVPGQIHLRDRSRNRSMPSCTPPPLPALDSVAPPEDLVVPGITPEPEELDDAAIEATLPPLQSAEALPDRPPVCPLEEAARSRRARLGLCTRGGLLRRIQLLRQLLRAWNNIGRLLPTSTSTQKLNPRARGKALLRNLTRMQELLEDFPPIFGIPGQPGFLVLGLLEQEQTALALNTLDEGQQAKLAEDWQAGYDLLRAHGRLLCEKTARFRGRGLFGRAILALRMAMVHQPLFAAFLIVLVTGNLLLWSWYAYRWWSGLHLLP